MYCFTEISGRLSFSLQAESNASAAGRFVTATTRYART